MSVNRRRKFRSAMSVAVSGLFLLQITAVYTGAYDLGTTVADMRQASSASGGTSCPQLTRFDISTPGSINRQWSTSLGTNPVTILTADQTPAGQLNEIEAVIQQSLSVWTGVSGTLLVPSTLGSLQRTSVTGACTSSDGLNSICFNQSDAGFALGVLAFTRVVSADAVGEQLSSAQRALHVRRPDPGCGCSAACPATPTPPSPLPPRSPRIRTPTTSNPS